MTTAMCLSLIVPVEHPCYEGHFPEAPILPGVVLLDMIMSQLSDAYGISISCIEQTKFLAPLLPGEKVAVTYTNAGQYLNFRVECERRGQLTHVATGKFLVEGCPGVVHT